MTSYNDESFGSIQMMPDEVEYLESVFASLPDNAKIVEWGMGGSTVHWLNLMKPTQTLVGIEHDLEWCKNVDMATRSFPNFTYFYTDVTSEFHEHVYGTISEDTPYNVAAYVCPDDIIYDADLYIIDGIVRGACLAGVLLNRSKLDSQIYMHDYTLREGLYNWITQFCRVQNVGTTLVKIERN